MGTHTHLPTSASAGVPTCSQVLFLRVKYLECVVHVWLLESWPTAVASWFTSWFQRHLIFVFKGSSLDIHSQKFSFCVVSVLSLAGARAGTTPSEETMKYKGFCHGGVMALLTAHLMCQLGVHWAACNGKYHKPWGLFSSCYWAFWPGWCHQQSRLLLSVYLSAPHFQLVSSSSCLQYSCCTSGCHIHVPSRKKMERQKGRVTASIP